MTSPTQPHANGIPHAPQAVLPTLDAFNQVLDALDDAVMLTDLQWRIVRVNSAFVRWARCRVADVQGRPWAKAPPGAHVSGHDAATLQALTLDGCWQGEWTHRRPDGEMTTEHVKVTAIRGSDGQATHHVTVFTDASGKRQQEERLRHMAMYDELTDLPNRRLLQKHLEQAMARALRRERVLAVCMLDLDGFKLVNDQHGHEAGDQVLAQLGRRMPEALRKTDLLARLGGDEFVLLVEDISGLVDLIPILDKVHAAITAPLVLRSGSVVQVGTSLGVYLYPFGEAEVGDQLLRCADQALYESKTHKGDRDRYWAVFGEKMARSGRTHARRLLDAGALEVWYQPIVVNKTDQVVGLEGLARLRSEDGLLLQPPEFLDQLDSEGLGELSLQVLARMLADAPQLDALGLPTPLRLSFNAHPRSYGSAFVARLRGLLAASGVAPGRVTLETLVRGNDFLESPRALQVMSELKLLGVRLSLDDVGTSYGSPLRLRDLPIDEIKLDQDIVRAVEDRPQDLHFLRVIQDLAMELKVDLVMEGVDTPAILDAMMTTGAPLMQGHAIARPMALAELLVFLQTPRTRSTVLPQTLFGYYAGTMASHNSIKKMFMLNPGEVDSTTLGDARLCRGHGVQERLGHGEGTVMGELHHQYHCAMGEATRHAPDHFKNTHWDAVESRLALLLEHMLDEWRKQSPST